jgi:hypothetical protein
MADCNPQSNMASLLNERLKQTSNNANKKYSNNVPENQIGTVRFLIPGHI